MKRRDFLKKVPLATAAPVVLNNIPVNLMAKSSQLQRIASSIDEQNDRVLVVIQMHGGNDGLNTLIPINHYAEYTDLRPNIAIPNTGLRPYIDLDSTGPMEKRIGLHPDMFDFKELYDRSEAAIVQSVAYDNMNQSHFRSRDIWFMGGDYDDYYGSGWMGRYLNYLYPGYPDAYPTTEMPDPLALEIGSSVSLAFHREEGIPAAIAIHNPDQFHSLISSVGVNPPESVEDTYYGRELQWIMGIEESANKYAGRLKDVYDAGSNSSVLYHTDYHDQSRAVDGMRSNGLAEQLKLVARLLDGGSKTKIFLCRIGGFDTHAGQTVTQDTTSGVHASLLYYVSSAIRDFMDDLTELGLSERVAGLTFSEFGRRARSNSGFGTDHGLAAPMLIFGHGLNPGIYGENPNLDPDDPNTNIDRGNLTHEFDYRQVFTSVLHDWMCASREAIEETLFGDYFAQRLSIFGPTSIDDREKSNAIELLGCHPNPVENHTVISFNLRRSTNIKLSLHDSTGRKLLDITDEHMMPGSYDFPIDMSEFPRGNYIYRLDSKIGKFGKQIIKVQ